MAASQVVTLIENSVSCTTTSTVLASGTTVTTTSSIVMSTDHKKRITRSSTATGSNVQSTYMKVNVSPPNSKTILSTRPVDHNFVKLSNSLDAQQLQLSSQAARIDEQNEKLDYLLMKMTASEGIIETMAVKIKKLEHEFLTFLSSLYISSKKSSYFYEVIKRDW